MRVKECNWMQLEAYLEGDDRIVLPLGSTEQHGYLSLATDSILSERVAAEAAEPLGVPVLPALPYGLTPYFGAYPGSPSLRMSTSVSGSAIKIRRVFRRYMPGRGLAGALIMIAVPASQQDTRYPAGRSRPASRSCRPPHRRGSAPRAPTCRWRRRRARARRSP